MIEADLKSRLIETLRKKFPRFVVLAHTENIRFGIPDISVTGHGKTSWWECKHANPDFKSPGIQELTLGRLAAAGYARYIIWEERGTTKRTLIVHPRSLGGWSTQYDQFNVGFNHRWMAEQIGKVHYIP